jgi:acetate kinase
LNFIYASHLGSGCSLSAIHGGKSVNTTMSFTPLDGLMMATRSGAIDPGVVLYLQQPERMSVSKVEHLLNHRSGLLGVSGLSADRRKLRCKRRSEIQGSYHQFCARIAEERATCCSAKVTLAGCPSGC